MEMTVRRAPIAALIRLTLLLAVEVAAIVAFHRLGELPQMAIDFDEFGLWLESTSIEDAVLAIARVVGLVAAYWLLASTVGYLIASATRIPFLVRSTSWATLPGIRKIIDGVVALSIIGGSVMGAGKVAFAQEAPRTAVSAEANFAYDPLGSDTVGYSASGAEVRFAQQPVPETSEPATTSTAPTTTGAPETSSPTTTDFAYDPIPDATTEPTTTAPPTTEPTTTTAPPTTQIPTTAPPTTQLPPPNAPVTPAPEPVPADPGVQVGGETAEQYTVVKGDNFWFIAERHLENRLGRDPSLQEVHTYWIKLIDTNRATIQSGDPNLIYPGEVFTLPPI